jgi:hypothetical protein
MIPRRLSVCALAAVLALLVVGCSSGGGKRAASTSTKLSTSTTSSTSRTTSSSQVVPFLGPCPKHVPNVDLVKANAGVLGLDRRLVPLPATTVRVCEYFSSGNDTPTRLVASRQLGRSGTEAAEATTNSLPVQPPGLPVCPGPQTPAQLATDTFFLSFADTSQRVDIDAVDGSCISGASNGTFFARLTTTWLNAVQHALHDPRFGTTGPQG